MSTTGERIKQKRQELGMTLEDVGRIVGVGKSTVRKWETGDIKHIGGTRLVNLAFVLHTTPYYLLGLQEATPEQYWKEEREFLEQDPTDPALEPGEVPVALSEKEQIMLNYWRDLYPPYRELVLAYMDGLSKRMPNW